MSERVVIVGNFGLRTKGTMLARALPLAGVIRAAGYEVAVVVPPWDSPGDSGRRQLVAGVPVYHTLVPPPAPLLRHAGLCAAMLARVVSLLKTKASTVSR